MWWGTLCGRFGRGIEACARVLNEGQGAVMDGKSIVKEMKQVWWKAWMVRTWVPISEGVEVAGMES